MAMTDRQRRAPPAATQPDGFLGRWSRRKTDAREGRPLAEPPQPLADPVAPCAQPAARRSGAPALQPVPEAPAAALPSLADVHALTAESDFAAFMARGVAPAVRNAAMKKLFADPHFNVMDGLDIYIDDYTKTTPLSAATLARMSGAKLLGLLDEASSAENARGIEQASKSDAMESAQPPTHEGDAPAIATRTAAEPPCTDDPPPALRDPRELS